MFGESFLPKEASNLFFRHSYVSTVPEREEEKTKTDPRGSDAIVFLLHCHCTQSCIWLTQPSRPSNTKSIQVGFIYYLITMSWRPRFSHIQSLWLDAIFLFVFSLHSWMGMTTVLLFSAQWVSGLVTFLFPGLASHLRAAYLPIHVSFGILIFVMACATSLTGITEKLLFSLK